MENTESNDISFLEIINLFTSWIKKFFRLIFNAIVRLIRYIYKKKILFGSTCGILLLFSAATYFWNPKLYEAKAIVHVYGSSPDLLSEVLKTMMNDTKSKTFTVNSDLPKDSFFDNINRIETAYVNPDYLDYEHSVPISSKDTTKRILNDRLSFRILMKGYFPKEELEAKLLNYLNNTPTLQENYESYIDNIQYEKDVCEREINRIDSLAQKTYEINENGSQLQIESGGLFLSSKQKQLFYTDLLSLSEKRGSLSRKLKEAKTPVVFKSGVVLSLIPMRQTKMLFLYPLLGGFILGCVIDLFTSKKARKSVNCFLKGVGAE